jgi:hypothetical protein
MYNFYVSIKKIKAIVRIKHFRTGVVAYNCNHSNPGGRD